MYDMMYPQNLPRPKVRIRTVSWLLCSWLLCCAASLLLVACGGKDGASPDDLLSKRPDDVRWPHERKAVRVNLRATADLNSEDGQAHTVFLCLYQLSRPDAFNAKAGTPEGIASLLECTPFDPSVVSVDNTIVQPGHVMGLVYDRMENAQFVGLVAGYATLTPHKVTRLRAIPVDSKQVGKLWWRETLYYPGPLEMAVLLGSHGLQQIAGENKP